MNQLDPAAERSFLAGILAEVIAIRRARVLSLLVLAVAMLSAGIGAALQAQGDRVDAVLLFSALSLVLVGLVCAVGALIAWRRLGRDVLDSVMARRPARARAPRTRNGGMAVAIGCAIFGLLLGWLLFAETPVMAVGVALACILLACLGPIWAGELCAAEERFAAMLDTDPDLARRFADFTPLWLHDALEQESTRKER